MGLNILIQNMYAWWINPILERMLGSISLFQSLLFATDPFDMPELVGSGLAVVITYLLKFLLDKFFVFKSTASTPRQTGRQFGAYFLFAILTTLENLGIQFLLGLWTPLMLNLRIIIALTCGYITKFFLDRKYVFSA